MPKNLYSICGVFNAPGQYNGAFAFGGYFIYQPLVQRIIDGQLADCFGISTINDGELDDSKLEFSKAYDNRTAVYKFRKSAGGVFVGEWNMICPSTERHLAGRAFAQIGLVRPDIREVFGSDIDDRLRFSNDYWGGVFQQMSTEAH
jgi:hypothetical protein